VDRLVLVMKRKRNTPARSNLPVYRDQRLENLPGERWEDVPGLDGYFQVSTLGRIKRLEREAVYPNGSIRIFPEKIILPRIIRTYNKFVRDYKYQFFAFLRVEGRKHYLPIRRLVYYCFVKPFALDDMSVCIVSIKGDGRDIRPDNLEMIPRPARTRRVFDQKRMASSFRVIGNQKGVLASLTVTRRMVSQYDQKGRKVKTFASISDAARAIGIGHSRISHVVNELEPTAGGFFWRFGKEKTFNVREFLAKRMRGYTEKRGTKVTQYDLKGNPIAYFISLQEAGKAVKGHWTAISAVIRGKRKTAYGYRWGKGYHNRKIKPLPAK